MTSVIPAQRTVRVKLATSSVEHDAARRLRHTVFCQEQGLFNGDDRDEIDLTALTLVAIGDTADEVIGTVRIHQQGEQVWWGSRLAVARSARRQAAVGSGLIKLAVGTAHALGCHTFLAHVQQQNVAMFTQLHWLALSESVLHGRPHSLMRADLRCYPPIDDAAVGLLCTKVAP
ncbi:GNAT family N-acetyltransferase [Duganella sp. FT94W]|uniref:GNAT family N-acetyltransferase n=1 Tax=Duganella lactea TaxID=2692173 RepID=A0ABW9V3J4_9BURK|nr:MSMEG_0567/Sll0786 family nitrogen starvation N-acetyltransferase [Duganella lactea]MYM33285.1 GNAT family N-acetyltransferase [Duganella lactea]